MRGLQGVPSACPTLEERQQVVMSEYLRAESVVASSMPMTSYSRPRYLSMSFSFWKWSSDDPRAIVEGELAFVAATYS